MRMHMGAIVSSYGSRSIVIQKFDRDGRPDVNRLQFIDDGHSLYHPLAYPLLFPVGNCGWYQRMQRRDTCDSDKFHSVSLTDYGRFMLMHRSQPSHLQLCGKLALEYAPVHRGHVNLVYGLHPSGTSVIYGHSKRIEQQCFTSTLISRASIVWGGSAPLKIN